MKQIDQPSCDTAYILFIARGCNHSQPVHFVQIHSSKWLSALFSTSMYRSLHRFCAKEASFLSSLLKQILKEHFTNSEGLATLWVSGSVCWNNSCNLHISTFLKKAWEALNLKFRLGFQSIIIYYQFFFFHLMWP